jgi:hypothetical protein
MARISSGTDIASCEAHEQPPQEVSHRDAKLEPRAMVVAMLVVMMMVVVVILLSTANPRRLEAARPRRNYSHRNEQLSPHIHTISIRARLIRLK